MAVTLTVSEVRQALQQAGGQPGDGAPSTAAIGTLFHRVLSELLCPDSPGNVESAVRDLDADLSLWKKTLKRHAYDQLVGPLLTQQMAALQSHGDKVQSLWIAVQDACDLLAELWWEITSQGRKPADQKNWFYAEQQIIHEVNQPGWREPVAIIGQADAVLQVPLKHRWCVLEWKLGRTSPEVDLGQACLYHMILDKVADFNGNSALALVSFRPNRTETVFEQPRLIEAQSRLVELIGKLAGVTPIGKVEGGGGAGGRSKPADGNGQQRPGPTSPQIPTRVSQQPASGPSPDWANQLKVKLLRVLRQSGAPCREAKPTMIGPTFARFFVIPERGITPKKVFAQAEQLHLCLGLGSPPSMEIIDGTIGVDLPRPDRVSIPFSQVVPHLPAADPLQGCSKVPVGIDLNAQWEWCDLAGSESAHMLVVGTPGSGKTQWLRTALASLLTTNRPDTLEVLLIDPKQNAFQFARNSPFLRQPIVVPAEVECVSGILDELIEGMTKRNQLFAAANCQDLMQYVQQAGEPMRRIVCICDEYADLLLQCEKQERNAIEHAFKRLAGMGRSAGIHLILATQQPRRDIVTPAIRSLIGAKVALRVSSPLESRVALNQTGAECLLGNGDLLYQCIGAPVRLQGAWLPSHEEQAIAAVAAVADGIR